MGKSVQVQFSKGSVNLAQNSVNSNLDENPIEVYKDACFLVDSGHFYG